MNRRLAFVFSFLIAAAAPTHAQQTGHVVAASLDLNRFVGRPVAELAAAVAGQPVHVRFSFETVHDGVHIGVLDLAQLGQARCRRNNGVSGVTAMVRDGIAVGTVRPSAALLLRHGLPAARTLRDGAGAGAPAPLPFAGGVASIHELDVDAAPGAFEVTCWDFGGGDAAGALQGLTLAPLVLIRPLENASRRHARMHGTALFDAIALGQALPADLRAQAREARVRLRVHEDGAGYRVITLDLGGRSTRGVAQPRSVGYVGVRGGVVEWKAIDPTGNALSDILCLSADGRRGPVRPGCSETGFYLP